MFLRWIGKICFRLNQNGLPFAEQEGFYETAGMNMSIKVMYSRTEKPVIWGLELNGEKFLDQDEARASRWRDAYISLSLVAVCAVSYDLSALIARLPWPPRLQKKVLAVYRSNCQSAHRPRYTQFTRNVRLSRDY